MALGKIARAKSLPQTKNRGQRLTLTSNLGIGRASVYRVLGSQAAGDRWPLDGPT
jgi:hypothetical protein